MAYLTKLSDDPNPTLGGNLVVGGYDVSNVTKHEINALKGVSTSHTVQQQLDSKLNVAGLQGDLYLNGHAIRNHKGPHLLLDPGYFDVMMGGPINSYADLILNPTASGARIVAKKDFVMDGVTNIVMDGGEITTEGDQNLVLNPGGDGAIIANAAMIQTANSGPPNTEDLLPYEFIFYIDFLHYPNTENPVPTLAVMANIPNVGSGSTIVQGPVINSLANLGF